jgi:hypothetical protein
VVNHIRDEIHHLREQSDNSRQHMDAVLAPFGINWQGSSLDVRFAAICVLREKLGVHLVMEHRTGAVTVLLMPGEPLTAARGFNSRGMRGMLLPTAYGSLAIVGGVDAELEPVRLRLEQALAYRG